MFLFFFVPFLSICGFHCFHQSKPHRFRHDDDLRIRIINAMQGESILEKAGESCSYLALVGWVVGCWKLTGGGRCDWIGLLHGEPSNGFPPGRPGCELMNHMLYVYIYIFTYTFNNQ